MPPAAFDEEGSSLQQRFVAARLSMDQRLTNDVRLRQHISQQHLVGDGRLTGRCEVQQQIR
jgi:hypothetical protein